jgi:ABC-type dipeptide/oligopeptide/nickel transport system permease component
MLRYVATRVVVAALAVLGAVTATFALIHAAPGDPVAIMFGATGGGSQVGASAAQREAIRQELGLDRTWPEQYGAWVARVARGDLGTSFRSRRAVATEMGARLPATLTLGVAAVTVQVVVGLGLGALAARRPGGPVDLATATVAMALVSLPSYWLGLLLLWTFAVGLGWVEVGGAASLPRVVLPAVTLGLVMAPTLLRVFRESLVEQRARPHVAFARARGLAPHTVLVHHLARPALLPAVALIGTSVGEVLGGAVVIESIFSWPGLGKYLLDSVLARDYPVVQGYMLFTAVAVVAASLVVDLTHGLIDPRLRTA